MPRTKQFNENDVLEKAMNLFWKQGYHGTSMDNLVKYLGVNRASLYGTFGGKRALYLKAFAHYRKTNFSVVEEQLKDPDSVKEQITQLFYSSIAYSIQDQDRKGCFVVNSVVELAPHDPSIQEIGQENQEKFTTVFAGLLEAGKESGELSPNLDVKATANYLFTLYSGLKVLVKYNTDRKSLESIVDISLKALS